MEDHFASVLPQTSSNATLKRQRDDTKDTDVGPSKRPAYDDSNDIDHKINQDHLSKEEIERLLAEADQLDIPDMDAAGVKKMVLSLSKKINKNQLERAKWANQPAKFMASELALHEEIQKLTALAAAPDLYPHFIKHEGVMALLGLLPHENTDIAVAVVEILAELLNPEAIQTEQEEDGMHSLVTAMLESDGLTLLIQNLMRLNESASTEEKNGVYHTMHVIEHFVELEPSTISKIAKSSFLEWILSRIMKRTFDTNKLFASELLATFVQSDIEIAKLCGSLGSTSTQTIPLDVSSEGAGIEAILMGISYYKKKNPKTPEEEECVENLFDALSAALMTPENQARFFQAEGFALMLRCIRENGFTRHGAFRIIDYAIVESVKGATNFVVEGGLSYIFPTFMGKGLSTTKKLIGPEAAAAEAKSAIQIVCSLAQLLPAESTERLRFIAKLLEKDGAKIDRLVELHKDYTAQIQKFEQKVERGEPIFDEEDGDAITAQLPIHERLYLKKLDNGLDLLQRIDSTIACLCVGDLSDARVRTRLWSKLYQLGSSLASVATTIQEHVQHMSDDKSDDQTQSSESSRKQRLQHLAEALMTFVAGEDKQQNE